MALVTAVVPPTRRNVELALLLFAIVVAGSAYAIVGLAVQGAVPQDWWLVGGWPRAARARSPRGAAVARPLRRPRDAAHRRGRSTGSGW